VRLSQIANRKEQALDELPKLLFEAREMSDQEWKNLTEGLSKPMVQLKWSQYGSKQNLDLALDERRRLAYPNHDQITVYG
jgi:hypothetical protein